MDGYLFYDTYSHFSSIKVLSTAPLAISFLYYHETKLIILSVLHVKQIQETEDREKTQLRMKLFLRTHFLS